MKILKLLFLNKMRSKIIIHLFVTHQNKMKLNNNRLGIVSQFQKLNWETDPTCGNKWNPDFAAIASAYGMVGKTISDCASVEGTLREAFAEQGPVLVNCLVDPNEDVSPMLLGGSTMDKMWSNHG